MSRQPCVVSIGSINADLQVRSDGWPKQSETLLARDFLFASGGKGTNVAYLAAKLGLPAMLVGRVGDDSFANVALQAVEHLGVDLTHVRRMPGSATGVSMIVVRDDGDKTIVLAPNANSSWEQDAERDVCACIERVAEGSVVCVDLEIPADLALAALRAARARGLCTVLDPSPGDRAQREHFAHSTYVVPNPREAERITGVAVRSSDDAERVGRMLLERGAEYACMKLPNGGAVLVSKRACESIAAPKVRVVDKTGAGDGFAAGLCAGLCQGLAARDAVRQAVAAASCAVTRYGSQAAYPTRAELDAMLAEVPA
jgi:ribokinase